MFLGLRGKRNAGVLVDANAPTPPPMRENDRVSTEPTIQPPKNASTWALSGSTDAYDENWKRMQAAGENPHGEADLIESFSPRSVLDGGCGTGRVAIELARRGIDVVGVDVDSAMLTAARVKAPELLWVESDLGSVTLKRQFDLIALPGNVMIFVAEGHQSQVVSNLASHLVDEGLFIAGFQLGRTLDLSTYDSMCAASGLELVHRWSTWDRQTFEGGNYAVSVHQKHQA